MMFLWNWNKTRCKNSIKIFLVMTSLIHTYFHEKVHLNRYGKTEAIWWSFSFFFLCTKPLSDQRNFRVNCVSKIQTKLNIFAYSFFMEINGSQLLGVNSTLQWRVFTHCLGNIPRCRCRTIECTLHSPFWREAPNHRYHFSSNET